MATLGEPGPPPTRRPGAPGHDPDPTVATGRRGGRNLPAAFAVGVDRKSVV